MKNNTYISWKCTGTCTMVKYKLLIYVCSKSIALNWIHYYANSYQFFILISVYNISVNCEKIIIFNIYYSKCPMIEFSIITPGIAC